MERAKRKTLWLREKQYGSFLHPNCAEVELADETESGNRCLVCLRDLPRFTCFLRSPIIAAVVNDQPSSDDREALLFKLFLEQCSNLENNPKALAYITLIEKLYPRQLLEHDNIIEALKAKAYHNVLGPNGNFAAYLLDTGSAINHSCAPNSIELFDQLLCEVNYISLCKVRSGEQLSISYIPFPIDSPKHRAARLPFECQCFVCETLVPPSLIYGNLDWLPKTTHCWWCGKANAALECQCGVARFCCQKCKDNDAETHQHICSRISTLK